MAISKKDVFNAIEKLQHKGQIATNQAILEITGGSNATIQKYRKEYFDVQMAQAIKDSIVLKDNEVSELTLAFSAVLKNRIDIVKTEHEIIVNKLNEALSESSKTNDLLTTETEVQQQKIIDSEKLVTQLQSQISFLKSAHNDEKAESTKKINELTELAYTQKGRSDLLEERLKKYIDQEEKPKNL